MNPKTSELKLPLGLPMSLFVNRQGRVQRIFIGGMTEGTIIQYVAEIVKT